MLEIGNWTVSLTTNDKQRVLTLGHQGWNDLYSLCRVGMEYYLPNDDNNDNDNIYVFIEVIADLSIVQDIKYTIIHIKYTIIHVHRIQVCRRKNKIAPCDKISIPDIHASRCYHIKIKWHGQSTWANMCDDVHAPAYTHAHVPLLSNRASRLFLELRITGYHSF